MREAEELSILQIRQMREKVEKKIENNALLASNTGMRKPMNNGQLLPDSEIKQKLLDKFDEMSSKPISMDDRPFSHRVGQYILTRVPHHHSLYPFQLAKGDICYTIRPIKSAKIVYKQSKPKPKTELVQIQAPKIQPDANEVTQIMLAKMEPKIELEIELQAPSQPAQIQLVEEPPRIEEVRAAMVELAKNLEGQPKIELQVENSFEYAEIDDEQPPKLEDVGDPQIDIPDISTRNLRSSFLSTLRKSNVRKVTN